MKFIKYNSIENVTNKIMFEFKQSSLYNPADKWVCTPKIHGANFSILVDEDGNLVPAKRTSIINMETRFFNFQKIFDKYETNLRNLIQDSITYNNTQIIPADKKIINISIHGELCGGYYPDTPSVPYASKVQSEIHYSNDTELIIFDIRLYVNEFKYYFMDHESVVNLCNKNNIPVVPILYKGYLDDCLKWSNEHNADPDETWKIFGMPHPVEGNIREGHVIKPLKSIFKGEHRIIFKDKNTKFKEGGKSKRKEPVKIDYSNHLLYVLQDIDDYINKNRFNSVVSKFGDYTIKNFGELMNLMVEDIKDELSREGLDVGLTNVDKLELHKILVRKVSASFVANKVEWF